MAGEAAIGVVLKAPLEEISEAIGPAKDHHAAEYRALIRGLEAARSRGIGHLRVCLDSALLVNQLNGKSKVKAEHLKPLHETSGFSSPTVRRHQDHVGAPNGERRSGRTCEHPTWAAEAQAETFNRRTSARIAPSVRSSVRPVYPSMRLRIHHYCEAFRRAAEGIRTLDLLHGKELICGTQDGETPANRRFRAAGRQVCVPGIVRGYRGFRQ